MRRWADAGHMVAMTPADVHTVLAALVTAREGAEARIAKWLGTTFGPEALTDRWERAARVVEEAIELAQAEGLTAEEMSRIAVRVYSRPAGEVSQEAAGLMVTLLAWAAGRGVDLDAVTLKEIERIEQPATVKRIRQKQAEKAAAGTGKALGHPAPTPAERKRPAAEGESNGT